jgi:hypothetical protein
MLSDSISRGVAKSVRKHSGLWVVIACCAFGSGILGGIVGSTNSAPWDKIVAAVASLGSLGAAFATYATVKEMRAARVLGARARITPRCPSNLIEFTWKLYPNNSAPARSPFSISARNASQGVAKNIVAHWRYTNPPSIHLLEHVKSMCGSGMSINIAADGYLMEFNAGTRTTSRMILGSSEEIFLGDMGPTQEDMLTVPVSMLNAAFVHWCGLLYQVMEGFPVRPEEVPAFQLSVTHDSPYERGIRDQHIAELHMQSFGFTGVGGRVISWRPGVRWRSFNLTLRLEFSSQRSDEKPIMAV